MPNTYGTEKALNAQAFGSEYLSQQLWWQWIYDAVYLRPIAY